MAEFAAGLGSLGTDVLGSIANKGRGVPNTEDSTLANALACRSPTCMHHIGNAEADGLITHAQANALRKAATGKADDVVDKYKKPISGSGKEKATDIPSWAKGKKPYTWENGKTYAQRLMDEKYGKGNWENNANKVREARQIQKHGDRGYQ